jgi:hypothetical protein
MMCPICGDKSSVVAHVRMPHECRVVYDRVCDSGHKFMTTEVHPTQLADAREMRCAVRNIHRRVSRYHRDLEIASDTRPLREIAEDFNITETRVRQIRTAMRERAAAANRGKSLPST